MESKQIRELLKSEVVREKIRVDAKYAWHWDCFLCLKGWGYAGVKRIGKRRDRIEKYGYCWARFIALRILREAQVGMEYLEYPRNLTCFPNSCFTFENPIKRKWLEEELIRGIPLSFH